MRTGRTVCQLLLLLALTLAGCGMSNDDARIIVPGGPVPAGGAYADTRAGVPFVVGDLIICLDRPGTAVIAKIDPIQPTGGFRIDAFAVIPNAMERGGEGFTDNSIPLAQQVSTSQPVELTKECPPSNEPSPSPEPPQSVALLLEYSKPTDATASDQGILATPQRSTAISPASTGRGGLVHGLILP
jgi:hypothetical protein